MVHAEKVRLRLNESLGIIAPHKTAYEAIALPHNQRLLDRYWEAEYSYRHLVDEESAKGKLRRAVGAIGNLSIATATRGELTKAIKDLPYDVEKKRQLTASLNQLLKFAKRDFKIIAPKKTRRKVKFLTPEEYMMVLAFMTNKASVAICDVAFNTGARQGEVYAIDPSRMKGDQVYIETQLTEDEEEKDPKWGSIRPAFMFDEGPEAIKEVAKYRALGQLPTRHQLRKEFSRACMKAFPSNPEKHLTFHDLRHSYAIRLLSLGVVLDLIAQSLGNSVAVCQEYYAGYVLTDTSMSMISMIVKKSKA